MDFQAIFKEDPSPTLTNNYLKNESEPEPDLETGDDFPIQDLEQLNNLSLTGPSFHRDYGVNASGYDPFGPFSYELASDDIEFMSFEPENGCGMMHGYMGHGCLTHIGKTFVGVSEFDSFVHVCDPTRTIPDEGSCVTGENGIKKNSGNSCKGKKKAKSLKGQWTKEEDSVVRQLVEKHGERKWSYIAGMLKGRIGKQCRERWHNHLRPNIKKDFWTEEEDRILIATHERIGNKWSEIAKKLPGRTENSIKNHWNATKRRQYTTAKCRTKWPKPSPTLQNYIKSLNLPRRKPSINKTSIDDPLTLVKQSSSSIQHEFYSSDRLMIPDFDFNEVPEFALDVNLLRGGSIESLLDDISPVKRGGDGEKIPTDLMEMISPVDVG
ncbi:hypothetical protein L1987_53597 [Smallanthus sonchifolius]|uniref:Uncharacterized protein n=1 Tax=Smallanthus sonchifolius TaxID=185202 RepID=A0ACB9EWD4_9ASTR|nr:hypothetical protein L1987_53597 [Smallanthus sonchifolius]